MLDAEVKRIVVAGGDAASAAAAAALAISLRGSGTTITLLTDGGGCDAPVQETCRGGAGAFHALLGIDEQTLVRATDGVFGLGTTYRDYVADGREAFVPRGSHGMTLRLVDFHHHLARLNRQGEPATYNEFSLPAAAAAAGRFVPPRPDKIDEVSATVEYDLYVDGRRYAAFMRDVATGNGVAVVAAAIVDVRPDAGGLLSSVELADGSIVEADFFVDGTVERKLASRAAGSGDFDDWSGWLPCDRVVSTAVTASLTQDLVTAVRCTSKGWLQQVPLASGTSLSLSYRSADTDDAIARDALAAGLHSDAVDAVRVENTRAGHHRQPWSGNCLAIGAAATRLERLDFPRLALAQSTILLFLGMLPRQRHSERLAAEFNRVAGRQAASARDYQLLRYALAGRRPGGYLAEPADLPESLRSRLDLFRGTGRFTSGDNEFVSKGEWVSSLINLGGWPATYDPLADMVPEARVRNDLMAFRKKLRQVAQSP